MDRPTAEQREQPQVADFWNWLTSFADWPAFDRLLFFTYGVRIVAVINALASLNVADLLKNGPRSPVELAEATGTDADTLSRVLRAAAAIGVFAEKPDGRFTLTAEAEPLRSDVNCSLRNLILLNTGPMMWRPYGELLHSLHTGKPAFAQVFDRPLYEHLEGHPEDAELFDRSMVQLSWLTTVSLLPKVDLSPFTCIADLGGGRGHFLAEALRKYPQCRGILFDLPGVLDDTLVQEYGVADRVTLMPGDFFEKVPSGCDAYVLKAVLDNWGNEDAETILRRIREAIADNTEARVFILEKIVRPGNQWDYSKLIDLDMLVLMGGRERTLVEWQRLIQAASFELVAVPKPTVSPWSVLECRPR